MLKYLLLIVSILFTSLTYSQYELIIKLKQLPFKTDSLENYWKSFKEDYQIKNIDLISKSSNIWKVSLKSSTSKQKIKTQLKLNPLVELVQENKIIKNRENIPNDPDFYLQWQHINQTNSGIYTYDMDSELAWDITTGGITINGKEIVVCIIDDGIESTHEDIVDNIWINKNEIPNNNKDDDNNGYIDDVYGYNFKDFNNKIEGNIGSSHGTAVSGIIGAKGNNGIGVSGVNWDIKMMHLG